MAFLCKVNPSQFWIDQETKRTLKYKLHHYTSWCFSDIHGFQIKMPECPQLTFKIQNYLHLEKQKQLHWPPSFLRLWMPMVKLRLFSWRLHLMHQTHRPPQLLPAKLAKLKCFWFFVYITMYAFDGHSDIERIGWYMICKICQTYHERKEI